MQNLFGSLEESVSPSSRESCRAGMQRGTGKWLHLEQIKCAFTASPRLQPKRSPLLLTGLKEVFRSSETKDVSSSSHLCFFPSFSVCGTTSSGGGRGQTIRLTVRADHCWPYQNTESIRCPPSSPEKSQGVWTEAIWRAGPSEAEDKSVNC